MMVRYSVGVVVLMIACGGSSTVREEGKASNGGNGGDLGHATGGSSGTTNPGHGGTSSGSDNSGSSGTGGVIGGGVGGASTGGTSGTSGSAGDLGGTGFGAIGGTGFGADGGTGFGAMGGSPTAGFGAIAGYGAVPGGGGDVSTGGEPTEGCGPGGCIGGSANMMLADPPGPVRCGGVECKKTEACCTATLKCFNPDTEADACAPPPPDDDLWGRTPCSSTSQCSPGWFCQLDGSLCQGTGHCQPSDNCGGCFSGGGTNVCAICACDGNTYPDVQSACLAGTFGPMQGAACGQTVPVDGGGFGGAAGAGGSAGSGGTTVPMITPCGSDGDCKNDGEVCCGITARCYPKDDPDQCATPPEGTRIPCTSNDQCRSDELCAGDGGCSGPGGCLERQNDDCGVLFDPVCGCDGISYTSAACARQRGTRVASSGQCSG